MIHIIDTYSSLPTLFNCGKFDVKRWKEYINGIYENSANIFLSDVEEYTSTGKYTFVKDFLPIIEAVSSSEKLNIAHTSFLKATSGLERKLYEITGATLDVDIVFYLGLCNGAGWVTRINGRDTVLLGIEKIIELDWCDTDSMYGLIYHELGHIYQMQHGTLERETDDNSKRFVWQLFCEGIAMHFEQLLVGSGEYFHQYDRAWKEWCDENFEMIKSDFHADLPTMTRIDQRYFGDWCDYYGRGDVGYYLGARFISHLSPQYKLKTLINMDIDTVYALYLAFIVGGEKNG